MISQTFCNDLVAQRLIACVKAMLEFADCLFQHERKCLGRQVLRIAIISIYAYESAEFERNLVAKRIELRNHLLHLLEERYGSMISVWPYYRYLQRELRMGLID